MHCTTSNLSACSVLQQFDLVCDRKLLGGLAQSFVVMGQGVGAVITSIFSDRCVYIPSSSEGRGCGRLDIFRQVCMYIPLSLQGRVVIATIFSDRCVYSPSSSWARGCNRLHLFFQTGERSCNPSSSWRRAFIGCDSLRQNKNVRILLG